MRKLKSGIIVLWTLLKVKLHFLFHKKEEKKIEEQLEELPRYKNPVHNVARMEFERRGSLIQKELEKYHIPDEKIEPVVEYAIKLLCSNAQMTDQRIVRKAADYFKLKPKMQAV
jgi:hypothetical protein